MSNIVNKFSKDFKNGSHQKKKKILKKKTKKPGFLNDIVSDRV